MKSACVGVLSIIELKNARWNIEILLSGLGMHMAGLHTIKFILVMIIYIKGVK